MTETDAALQAVVDTHLPRGVPLRVLEAGCGSTSHLCLRDGCRLVGIDISARQLERNARLDEKVEADLQVHPWQPAEPDMVVCWDVLEHLPNPNAALARMFDAVKRGGLLLLAMPNRGSLKGLVTRMTPFGFHAWFYRHVIGDKRPSRDLDQFPTYLRKEMAPKWIVNAATGSGFSLVFSKFYEGPVQLHMRSHHRLADAAFATVGTVGRILTFGAYDPTLSDCILLFRKSDMSVKPRKAKSE